MAKIPTILADTNVGGPMQSRVAEDQFFSGSDRALPHLAKGLSQFAAGMGDLMEVKLHLNKKLKDLQDAEWVNNSTYQYKKEAAEFSENLENAKSPTFYEDFNNKFEARHKEIADSAPSAEARVRFSAHAREVSITESSKILRDTVNAKLQNAAVSIGNLHTLELDNFSNGRNQVSDVLSSLANREAEVDRIYGNMLPKTSARVKEQLIVDTVLRVAERDTDKAREILGSRPVDGPTRKQLLSFIEREEAKGKELFTESVNNAARNALAAAATSNFSMLDLSHSPTPLKPEGMELLTIENFKKAFGKDEGQIRYDRFRDQLSVYVEAQDFVNKVSGKNSEALSEALNSYKLGVNSVKSREVYENVSRRIEAMREMIDKDPVAYIKATDPEVNFVMKELRNTQDPERVQFLTDKLNSRLLLLQSPAEEGAPDADYRLVTPTPHLMAKQEAEAISSEIAAMSPDQAVVTMASYADRYGANAPQALSDLITLPSKSKALPPGYRILLQNYDQPFAKALARSLSVGSEFLKMSEDGAKKEVDAVMQSSDFREWSQHIGVERYGDMLDIAKVAAAYGVMDRERGHTLRDPSGSKTTPVNLLLGSTLSKAEINGNKFVLPKRGHSDEAVDKAKMGLSKFAPWVDYNKINIELHLPTVKALQGEERLNFVSGFFRDNGYFLPSNDGQKMMYVINDDFHEPTYVQDSKGNPLFISMEDIYNNFPLMTFSYDAVEKPVFRSSNFPMLDLTAPVDYVAP